MIKDCKVKLSTSTSNVSYSLLTLLKKRMVLEL